ncbi:hypothetical protein M409DRAFT_24948 [Zasmidium cellare ATCC 36951]|uniref:Alkaline phytoceramidase n=1 Tax=Zasmidium cellare ATCC 36951 TaxID=1080233 RepID=A0A6A6CEF8_ZASCE|nr:uncharacterized protein M409DRAFT_24948 [Zasmidium cellare ATCC 36951]KAF2164548.1 hypothetical protein M409DRAFT_24948 [Zasmidium cellare ATCC 36951]
MTFSVPYPSEPLTPAFGPPTSKANFCEEDFVVSAWIAEFVNTLSNLTYVLYAIRGFRRSQHGSHAAKAMYAGLALVGICSALFHGLLKYWSQMFDDTSMIIASATVLHRSMTYGQSKEFSQIFTPTLVALVVIETIYHTVTNEIKVHELAFLILIALVALRTRQLVKQRVSKEQDRRRLRWVIALGAGCMVFGYFLWQLDFRYCAELTQLKRAVGMPWSFVLEFHGWWHVLTAVGAFTFMSLVESLTQERAIVSVNPFSFVARWFHQDEEKQR